MRALTPRHSPRRLSQASLLRGVRELSDRDRDLAGVIQRFGPPPLWARRPGFATLVRIILEQQVSLASAEAAYSRLQSVAGRVTPHHVEATTKARLRRLPNSEQLTRMARAWAPWRAVAARILWHAYLSDDRPT